MKEYCSNCGREIISTTSVTTNCLCENCSTITFNQNWRIAMPRPKYKIGDWVMLEGCGDRIKMRVISIIEETCSAGKQIHYVCRTFLKTSSYSVSKEGWYPSASKEGFELKKYNEVELQPFKEEKEEKKK